MKAKVSVFIALFSILLLFSCGNPIGYDYSKVSVNLDYIRAYKSNGEQPSITKDVFNPNKCSFSSTFSDKCTIVVPITNWDNLPLDCNIYLVANGSSGEVKLSMNNENKMCSVSFTPTEAKITVDFNNKITNNSFLTIYPFHLQIKDIFGNEIQNIEIDITKLGN
ncbi:MAG: hypothetical protein MJ174_02870 [Treponema sp.]|nr:hypothetical protein [Treponema sp.]